LRYCSRIVALKAGSIVYDGPPQALSRERLADIYGEELVEALTAPQPPSTPT
jgi:phosphonate transport system ATP-binding protein